MAVIAHLVFPDLSREQYDAVRAACGWLEAPPDGAIAHMSWWEGADNHNLDAWESEELFAAFGEGRLAEAMQQAGVSITPQVTFHAAHEVFAPSAATITATSAST